MVVVSASTATHWDLNGEDYPKGWEVIAWKQRDALLIKEGFRPVRIPGGSTVGGAAPPTQDSLVAALVPIVGGASSGGPGGPGGATALTAAAPVEPEAADTADRDG